MGTNAAHTAAGELVALAGEGEPEAVKSTEGEADAEGEVVAEFEGDVPTDSVAEGDAVPDSGGVPLGVGALEPVTEDVAVGSR